VRRVLPKWGEIHKCEGTGVAMDFCSVEVLTVTCVEVERCTYQRIWADG
jgi:hypothetical protein